MFVHSTLVTTHRCLQCSLHLLLLLFVPGSCVLQAAAAAAAAAAASAAAAAAVVDLATASAICSSSAVPFLLQDTSAPHRRLLHDGWRPSQVLWVLSGSSCKTRQHHRDGCNMTAGHHHRCCGCCPAPPARHVTAAPCNPAPACCQSAAVPLRCTGTLPGCWQVHRLTACAACARHGVVQQCSIWHDVVMVLHPA